MKHQVFLGGSCNPTTWRADIAIPVLRSMSVAFYNPQVEDWHDGLVALEAQAKSTSKILLFVIDGQTRAVASMLEATEYASCGRDVRLVIDDIPSGLVVDGQAVHGRELKDLNRARAYLRDIATRYERVRICRDVRDAVNEIARDLA